MQQLATRPSIPRYLLGVGGKELGSVGESWDWRTDGLMIHIHAIDRSSRSSTRLLMLLSHVTFMHNIACTDCISDW